jgi:hypothetical protein
MSMFDSVFDNFLGQTLNVVHPNKLTGYTYLHVYPDNKTIRAGADYEAMKSLSEVLNFKLKYNLIY